MTVRKKGNVPVNASVKSAPELAKLPPELQERLHRMAQHSRKTAEQVIADAIQVEWVRFACRERLKPDEW